MSSIVVNPKNEKELKFVSELLGKLGVNAKILSDEQQEDLGLGLLMRDSNRSEIVSHEEVFKKLKN